VKINDLLFGLIIAGLGLAVLIYAGTLPDVPGHYYGPGLFPTVIGAGFLVCGGVLAGSTFKSRERSTLIDCPDWRGASRGLVQVALMSVAILVFVGFGDLIGFRLFAFVTLAAMYLVAGRGLLVSLLLAVVITALLDTLFVGLLGVPLPVGELPGLSG